MSPGETTALLQSQQEESGDIQPSEVQRPRELSQQTGTYVATGTCTELAAYPPRKNLKTSKVWDYFDLTQEVP